MQLIKSLAEYLTQTLRKSNVLMLAMAVMIGMALCCTNSLAQSGAGSIQGTVTDSTGAVIVGASVHVVNQATNVATDTKSNGVGFYSVPELFTGTYVVTISASGMKTYKTSIELQASQEAVINPSMSAGAVTQQVEVAADVIQLTTTDNGSVTSTLENSRINQLPMNGRQVVMLVQNTTPGLEAGGLRANGLEGQAMEYVEDGAPMDNRNFGTIGNGGQDPQAALPDPDAVQEVHVETSGESAEYATPATAVITIKSGTNSLHGSLFETARNNVVGIARNRQTLFGTPNPHLVRNEFGASAGGPIVIPRVYHGKDKSFWFFGYERYSLAQSASQLDSVPTCGMRGLGTGTGGIGCTTTALTNADFSGVETSVGVYQQLYDWTTTASSAACNGGGANSFCRKPFGNGILKDPGNNQIPMTLMSPAAKILDAITPQPTNGNNPNAQSNHTSLNPIFTVVPTFTFRIDHSFTENNKAYLRYTQNIQTSTGLMNFPANAPGTIASTAAPGFPAGAEGLNSSPSDTFNFALGFTHVFSPAFYAETILSNQWQNNNSTSGGNPNLDYEKMLGMPNPLGESGFPYIGQNTSNSNVNEYGGSASTLLMGLRGSLFNYDISQIISNLDENLSKTVGKHQLMFGGRYRHERIGYLTDRNTDSALFGQNASALELPSSGTNYTATPNTGWADADFFLGAPATYTDYLQGPYGHFHDMETDIYFQDNYRVAKNLTVNLGLRYESHPATWTKYGLMEGTDLKNHALVLPYSVSPSASSPYVTGGFTTAGVLNNLANIGVKFETPAQAGFPDAMMRNYNLNFSPRIGLAYQPFGNKWGTVLRAAYGRFIYPIPMRNSLKNAVKSIPFQVPFKESYTSATQAPDGLNGYLLRENASINTTAQPTTIMGLNSSNAVDSTSATAVLPGLTPYGPNPSAFPPEFVTEMNFTIEQPIKGNSALRVSYLWTHGTNLDQYYLPNLAYSTYAWETLTGTTPPAGTTIGLPTYAATALGPYDQTIFGGSTFYVNNRMGFSNDYALEVNYQRLFHHGIAYQISYTRSNPYRVGGASSNDSNLDTAQDYVSSGLGTMAAVPNGVLPVAPAMPPPRPAGLPSYLPWRALNKYEGYQLDSAIPKTHIQFNGIVDLPFGRGKKLLGNANRFVDELVGGYQLAGDGSIVSQDFAVGSGNWGPTNPLKVYKHNAPQITDCRSGTCYKAYMWFNGYIAPNVINAATKGVSGLPSDYMPYQVPLDNSNISGDKNYGTNNVSITLLNSTVQTVAFSPGPTATNPLAHKFLNGPNNWTADLSLFKVFPITERVNLRFNMDAFNVFNHQGYPNPNTTDGTQQVAAGVGVANSYPGPGGSSWTPRQVQFTLRLSF